MIRSLRRTALSTDSPQAGEKGTNRNRPAHGQQTAERAAENRPSQNWLSREWLMQALPAFWLIFGALWLLHLPLLRLPYFWDEAGYFIPAARDLLLTGDLIPHTTLSNAHPPLVMLWLALCWKLTTYSPLVTRTAMLLVAAFGFTALWLLARRVAGHGVASHGVAAATVLLTALSPTVFVQSAMAHLDIAAFALVLWTLYAHLCGKPWVAIAFAALAAVAKETTVAVTLALFAYEILGCLALRWPTIARWWPTFASGWQMWGPQTAPLNQKKVEWGTMLMPFAWLLALLPLVGWYAYHLQRTGHVLGNPDYLRYNVGATVTPWRIAIALAMRLWHAAGYMNLWVLTASALLVWWGARYRRAGATAGEKMTTPAGAAYLPAFDKDANGAGIPRGVQVLFALIVVAQVAEFSVVGGALLARYMIPALGLVILLSVDVLCRYAPRRSRVPSNLAVNWLGWKWWIAVSAAAFVAALFFNPPWYIAPEDNLTWAQFVRMHQHAARYAEQHYAADRILTAWPASDELNRPFLGYVRQPLTVVRVENFTPEQMLRAREQEEGFDVVLAFSTKFEPRRRFFPRVAGWTRAQTRYFDFHQDLPPAAIARLLQGRIVWQESSPGEWIALIEIDKARNACLMRPR